MLSPANTVQEEESDDLLHTTVPYLSGLDLVDFTYGDGKTRFLQAVLEREPREFPAICTSLCQATHKLSKAIRSLRAKDASLDLQLRIDALLTALHVYLSLLLMEPVGLFASGSTLMLGTKSPDKGTLLYDLRYADMLLHCCANALDALMERQPHPTITICAQEAIPLHQPPNEPCRVNRMSIEWDLLTQSS